MSPSNYKIEKMGRHEARKLISYLMAKHPENVIFSAHSLTELSKDGLSMSDAINVLKSTDAKIMEEGEFERGSYRYRLHTTFICLVVAFDPIGTLLVVVTAWDKRKGKK